jgi:hypothetical protein
MWRREKYRAARLQRPASMTYSNRLVAMPRATARAIDAILYD